MRYNFSSIDLIDIFQVVLPRPRNAALDRQSVRSLHAKRPIPRGIPIFLSIPPLDQIYWVQTSRWKQKVSLKDNFP